MNLFMIVFDLYLEFLKKKKRKISLFENNTIALECVVV